MPQDTTCEASGHPEAPSTSPIDSSLQHPLGKYAVEASDESLVKKKATSTDSGYHSNASNKKHKCPYCDTEFTRHHNLKSHLLTHSQEKPYLCQTCNLRFRRLHDLKRHGELHTTSEKPHVCPKCDRKFARGDALARHCKAAGGCTDREASYASYGEEEEYDHGGTSQGVEVSKSPRTTYASNKNIEGVEWGQFELWPEFRPTPDPLSKAAFRPHGGFVGLEDDLRQSQEPAVNAEDMGYPERLGTAYSVGTKTSSVSESEGNMDDGTTWYGPTWLSTALDPAMALGDAYPYISLESEAVKKVIHAFQENQGDSDKSTGQGTGSWSSSPSTSTSQTDPRTTSKRKLGGDETEREQGPVIKKGRKQIQDGQPRLACHFQKMNPVKWARCGMREAGFARISDIKQHFRRHHMRNPNYCPICGSTFPSEEVKNDHIRQSRANPAICPEQPTPHLPDGLSHDKLQLLTERVKASADISGQWYSIWAMLFPDVTPPPTHTYDLSDRLHNSVRDLCLFLETEGPAIGQSILEQENVIIGPSSAANIDLADFNMGLFTRRVLSRVFNETVQSWVFQESYERNRRTGSSGHVSVPLTPVSGSSNDKRLL